MQSERDELQKLCDGGESYYSYNSDDSNTSDSICSFPHATGTGGSVFFSRYGLFEPEGIIIVAERELLAPKVDCGEGICIVCPRYDYELGLLADYVRRRFPDATVFFADAIEFAKLDAIKNTFHVPVRFVLDASS